MKRAIQVIPPIVEASILNYHGDPETLTVDRGEYQSPRITRREVEDELSFDLIAAAMQGAI